MSYLKKRDKIAVIAPSVGLKDKKIDTTLKFFKTLNLVPVLADNLNSCYRYMAGTDEERANTINKLFADKSIKALFCLRGGAGATRMLPYLNYATIKKNPKPIIGLSDSTALQNALITKASVPSFTGFLPLYDLSDKKVDSLIKESLQNALFENDHKITSGKTLIKGKTKGQLVGGCLSVLLYLCGTSYFPDLTNKILILEDVGEKTYKIDLMLNQLKKQKNFKKLKGIVFGTFKNCPIVDPEDGTIEDCINDFIKDLNIPVVTNFAYGHIPSRYLVPLGIEVKLTSDKNGGTITW